jgi:hypothetical protein
VDTGRFPGIAPWCLCAAVLCGPCDLACAADAAPAAITPDGGRYYGALVDGKGQGQGRIEWDSGAVYQGGFANGLFSGRGHLHYPNGDEYDGDFASGKQSGRGTLTLKRGATYTGEFRADAFDGQGRYDDGAGTVYQGHFVKGAFAGHGVITIADGRRYEGEVKQWVPDGEGRLRLANGDVYQGHFEKGLYDGPGKLTFAVPQPDGRTRELGLWRAGRLQPAPEEPSRRVQPNVEVALHSQPALLSQALAALAPRRDGINLYLLAVAGDGTQEVFRREVEFVRTQFDADFGTRGHSVLLVNSRNTVGTAPMATISSIRQALKGIAASMDPERDILFLYITSHGSAQHVISLALEGMQLTGLSARDLSLALNESGIRWKVIVISACYSGGFINDLRDPRTLIITAARSDRRSFGCADENDFTYFGRAFFKESLPKSASFEDAFVNARRLITDWEDQDAHRGGTAPADTGTGAQDGHSLPQMNDSAAIRDHLRRWQGQLAAAPGR